MKMKEVCARTGLTERAVRFYVREGLIAPPAQERGGRIWLDFSEENVARLRSIATLRKAGFTIDEIRSMGRDFQKNAPHAAFALRQRLREAIESYERLSRTDTVQAADLEQYAALLEQEVRDRPLPHTDRTRAAPINGSDLVEWLCMLGMVYLFWRLYACLMDRLFFITNIVVYLMPFVIILLPISLILGSRAGKWLYRHFEYVP